MHATQTSFSPFQAAVPPSQEWHGTSTMLRDQSATSTSSSHNGKGARAASLPRGTCAPVRSYFLITRMSIGKQKASFQGTEGPRTDGVVGQES